MKMIIRLGMSLLLAALASVAHADDVAYPDKPVRIVVGFPPGSISDIIAHVLATKMGNALGRPFQVENKAGANGGLAAARVARAPADGYTLLMGTNSINAINLNLFKSIDYDPARDFAPVGMAAEVPALLVARNDLPVASVAELSTYANSHGQGLVYASGTATAQVAGALLKQRSGAALVNKHYDGELPGLAALMAGDVDLMILNIPIAYPYIMEGRIKAIAVLGPTRAAVLPKVPTVGETLHGYAIPTGWVALFAPAGTPRSIIAKLNNALRDALQAEDTRERVEVKAGTALTVSSPNTLGKRVADDTRQWAAEIKSSGIAQQ